MPPCKNDSAVGYDVNTAGAVWDSLVTDFASPDIRFVYTQSEADIVRSLWQNYILHFTTLKVELFLRAYPFGI